MLRRFIGWGLAGWALEVAFTGVSSGLRRRDRRLLGHSYLWMLPIYGAGGLLLEALHDRLAARRVPRWLRSLAYTAGIYGVEYSSAAFMDRVTGTVPWRYMSGLHLRGYVRLDYAPFWYACGWLFEPLAAELSKLQRATRRAPRAFSAPGAGAGAARRRVPWAAPVADAAPRPFELR
jgi:hypothetical protein